MIADRPVMLRGAVLLERPAEHPALASGCFGVAASWELEFRQTYPLFRHDLPSFPPFSRVGMDAL